MFIIKQHINFTKQILVKVLFVVMLSFGTLYGQQDAQFTQFQYNTASVNPAYVGSRGHLSIAALHRSQWVGLDGAPTTQTLNVHSPIGYRGVGLGVSFVKDDIGPTSETNFDIDLSYTIYTSNEGKLSFGLKVGANLLDIRFSELNQFAPDATLAQDIDNRLTPNIGAGVYYHTNNFFVGLSVPRVLETSHFEETSLSTASEQMNFYLITGYVWDLNRNLKFKPTLLTKALQGAPLQVDISANFLLNEKFYLGAGYRWDAAASALVGFNISEGFFLGLAYDKEITDLGGTAFNDGSFEVVFRYDFISSKRGLKSPRFF